MYVCVCVCFQMLCSRARLVSYLPGLHVLVYRVTATKTFSSVGSLSTDERPIAVTSLDMGMTKFCVLRKGRQHTLCLYHMIYSKFRYYCHRL